MLTHEAFEEPELIKYGQWLDQFRTEYQRVIFNDLWYDLERAARLLYLQRISFGGNVDGRTFGMSRSESAQFDLTKLVPLLEAAHERLSSVTIDCLAWQDFIRRWDSEGTLFLLDPPYYGVEDYYGKGQFGREEFEMLVLQSVKGRFILTLNDVPEVRRLFAWATIEPAAISYSCSGKWTEGRELIITGRG